MKVKFIFILMMISSLGFGQITTIYDIQGQAAASPLDGDNVTTKGIVTAAFSSGYFIQDGDTAWTGIYIYDNSNVPAPGDSVQLTGDVSEYYELTEISNITDFTVLSQGNPMPEPAVINTGDASEPWESVLIRVESATCTNPDIGYGEFEVDDGTGPLAVDDLGIAYSPMQGLDYRVTGPLNYSFSAFKIEPRNENDIVVDETIYFTERVTISTVEETEITFNWSTNTEASSEISYGLTPELEMGTVTAITDVTDHSLTLDGLAANEIYYVKPFSVTGEDTTVSQIMRAATASTSTGEINVYFNHSIDSSVAWENYAVSAPNAFVDTIISYIDLAQNTLDITMYDIVDTTDNEVVRIMNAINDAYDRGVTVRYITDDEPENGLLDSLNTNIPVLRGNADGIMHDKFIVIDAESIIDSWVMTGSTNHTISNLNKDYNNIICIQDHQLAKTYTMEFNEMWGSETATPDAGAALFGSNKTDNTPHSFNVGGTRIDCYFSPSDQTTKYIAAAIDNAQESLQFGLLVFTENRLGTAVLDAHNRGIEVAGIVDYTQYSGDEYSMLAINGVNVLEYENEDGSEWPVGATLHHKYAIVDQDTDNAVLITGSHNWSASAESINDENTLLIYDRNIANLYYQEFSKRFAELEDLMSVESLKGQKNLELYPNPNSGTLHINSQTGGNATYRIFSINGQMIQSGTCNGAQSTISHNLKPGLYILEYQNNYSNQQIKFVVE